MNRLPDKPSELLRVALSHFLACEQDSKYVIDMSRWYHAVHETMCEVCFAGSVIAGNLMPDVVNTTFGTVSIVPWYFDDDTENKLCALDAIRQGGIFEFFNNLDLVKPESLPSYIYHKSERGSYIWPDYHINRDDWMAWIEGFIGILEAEGL